MFAENHVLTKDEILQYQKDGYDLDEKKLYVIKFLFNDKWNQAADPRPFRIKTELIEKLAKDSIGMPYVVNPKNTNAHLRGTTEGRNDTAKDLLEIQAKYSIGTIKVPIIKPNKNVYGIIEVWKDYEQMVLEEQLPPFTSPTIFILKEDADGIEDGQFLNINAVGSPGYEKLLAGTHAVCKGGIKMCMEELAPIGASGKLIEKRNDPTFLNSLISLQNSMSANPDQTGGQNPAPSVETLAKDVDAIKGEITNINTKLDDIASKVGADDQNMPPVPPVGAAGKGNDQTLVIPKELKNNEFVKKLVDDVKGSQAELAEIKKYHEEQKQKIVMDTRRAHATSIVEKLILLKQIKPEDKEAKIAEYLNLKNDTGEFKDLEVLDNFLKSTVSKEINEDEIVGASGYGSRPIKGDKPIEISNEEALEMLS